MGDRKVNGGGMSPPLPAPSVAPEAKTLPAPSTRTIFYAAAGSHTQPWYHDATSTRGTAALQPRVGRQILSDEPTGLNADPRFYDPHGTRDTNRDNDFRILDATSPVVDHGSPASANRIDILGHRVTTSAGRRRLRIRWRLTRANNQPLLDPRSGVAPPSRGCGIGGNFDPSHRCG